jgi:hypothetical protein
MIPNTERKADMPIVLTNCKEPTMKTSFEFTLLENNDGRLTLEKDAEGNMSFSITSETGQMPVTLSVKVPHENFLEHTRNHLNSAMDILKGLGE